MSSLTQNFDSTNQVTMTQLRLLILLIISPSNWLKTILRHDHFMSKVPKY
jgi:hypothetical protein